MMSKPPISVGKQVMGYISTVSAKATSEGVIYVFTLSTVWGDDVVFRMRQPPEWVFVGTPVSGNVVHVDDVYQMQDLSLAKELALPRAVEVESCEATYIGSEQERKAIVTGKTANAVVSAPALTLSIAKKAEKVGYQRCVIHLADLPIGNRVVAVQSQKEYRRDRAMRKFIDMFGAEE